MIIDAAESCGGDGGTNAKLVRPKSDPLSEPIMIQGRGLL